MKSRPPEIEMRKSSANAAQRVIGYRGEKIETHRALLRLIFPLLRWIDVLLIPLCVTACLYLAWPWISEFWRSLIAFWSVSLDGDILLRTEKGWLPGFATISSPYGDATLPTPAQWYSGMAITLALLFGPALLPGKMLPMAYALRMVGLIQATAQVYFYFWPTSFHYEVGKSFATLTQVSLLIMLIAPWIYALIYNIFDFGFTRKLFLSVLAVSYLIILVPLQYLLASELLLHCSVLWYPLIYLLGSTLLQLNALVALYAWAMSWQRNK